MSHISQLPPLQCFLVVFGSVYFAALMILCAVRVIHKRRWWQPIQGPTVQLTGTLLGLVLAFLLAGAWKQVSDARNTIYKEVSGFYKLHAAASVLDDARREHILKLAREYVNLVLDEEWSYMQDGGEGPKTKEALSKLRYYVARLSPDSLNQSAVQRTLVDSIDNIITARSDRLNISRDVVSGFTWMIVFLQAATVLLAVALFHDQHPKGQVLAVWLVATVISGTIFLVFIHDQPFAHDELVNSEAFAVLLSIL
ncbi:MAG: DUF4239 domain-containing protein [Deltaproteobacteria bacterium]|nr:DUF4239 domain-containing protein [Deltaproteobacteria bacterium]